MTNPAVCPATWDPLLVHDALGRHIDATDVLLDQYTWVYVVSRARGDVEMAEQAADCANDLVNMLNSLPWCEEENGPGPFAEFNPDDLVRRYRVLFDTKTGAASVFYAEDGTPWLVRNGMPRAPR